MKYLYAILRLFFCPHNYTKTVAGGKYVDHQGRALSSYYDKECKHCGKIKRFES